MARIDEISITDLFRVSVYAPQFDLQFIDLPIHGHQPPPVRYRHATDVSGSPRRGCEGDRP